MYNKNIVMTSHILSLLIEGVGDLDEKVEKKYILNMMGKYSDMAIDHARNPRNVGNIPKCDGFGQEEGECGDTMAIWISVKNDRVINATFWTDGCGTSIACGSMVTELVMDRSIGEAHQFTPEDVLDALGGLPEDHEHCATLAVNALQKALQDHKELQKFPWKKLYQ